MDPQKEHRTMILVVTYIYIYMYVIFWVRTLNTLGLRPGACSFNFWLCGSHTDASGGFYRSKDLKPYKITPYSHVHIYIYIYTYSYISVYRGINDDIHTDCTQKMDMTERLTFACVARQAAC